MDALDGADWGEKCNAAEIMLAYMKNDPVLYARVTNIRTGGAEYQIDGREAVLVEYDIKILTPPPFFPLKYSLADAGSGSQYFLRQDFVTQMSASMDHDRSKIHDRREKILGHRIPSYIGYGYTTSRFN